MPEYRDPGPPKLKSEMRFLSSVVVGEVDITAVAVGDEGTSVELIGGDCASMGDLES